MKLTYKITIICYLVFIASNTSFCQIPRLHIEGRNIYNHKDSLIILRGFNHSRWGEVLPEDATIIKDELGANSVRTCLRWYYWNKYGPNTKANARQTGAPGHIKPSYLQYLDDVVTWFSQKQIWTVLFVNSDQGSGANEKHFFNTPELAQEFMELWLFLAERYKNVPYIAAFEILAEPRFEKYNRGVSHANLAQFYKKMADTINTVTKGKIPFVIGPMNHYKAANLTADYFLEGYPIIYAANMLWPKPYILGKETYGYPSNKINLEILNTYYTQPLAFRETYNVPVWVDQFGASYEAIGYEDYTRDIINYFDSLELHWSYWNFRAPNPSRSLFNRVPKNTGDYVKNLVPFKLLNTLLSNKGHSTNKHIKNSSTFYPVIANELKIYRENNITAEITIYDTKGNLITTHQSSTHLTSIPLEKLGLLTGMYVVNIKQGNRKITGKFYYS